MRLEAVLLLTLVVRAASHASDTEGGGELSPQELKEINFLVMGMRGFWTGFERSLFSNDTLSISPLCFDDETVRNIYFVFKFLQGRESITEAMHFVQASRSLLYDNMLYCGFEDAVEAIKRHCDTSSCTQASLAENLTS